MVTSCSENGCFWKADDQVYGFRNFMDGRPVCVQDHSFAGSYTQGLVMTQRRHSPNRDLATLYDHVQRFLRTKIVLLVLLIGIASCGKNQHVEEREAYWIAEAEQFFQTPRDMADLHSWLREKQVFYTFEDKEIVDGKWVKGVEEIYVDGFVCESWTILLTVTVNDEDEILTHDVGKAGTCL